MDWTSWELGFEKERGFLFLNYDIGAEHEETGPCRVADEEVGTLKKKKKVCQVQERNIKREIGLCFKFHEALSYFLGNSLHLSLSLLAGLAP